MDDDTIAIRWRSVTGYGGGMTSRVPVLAAALTLLAGGPARAECPRPYTVCEPIYLSDGTLVLIRPRGPVVLTSASPGPGPALQLAVRSYTRGRVGLGLRMAGGYGGPNGTFLWGPGGSIRLMATPGFALQIDADAFFFLATERRNEQGSARVLVPFGLATVWLFDTGSRAQPYLLVGFGALAERRGGASGIALRVESHAGVGGEVLLGSLGLALECRALLALDEEAGLAAAAVLLQTGIIWYP